MSRIPEIESAITDARERITNSRFAGNRLVTLVWRVIQSMGRDDATHLAAGIAYYGIFSLFPLMIGFLAILGLFLGSEELQHQFLDFITDNIPGVSPLVSSNIEQIVRFRSVLGIGALLGLAGMGLAVFGAISRAINRAWGIRKDRPFYINIPLQLSMSVILGTLLLLSTVATSIIQLESNLFFSIPGHKTLVNLGLISLTLYLIPTAFTLVVFMLLYRFVPNRKMRWSYVWPGAVIATGFFELAKSLFIWYLDNMAIYDQIYGSLTSAIVFLVWAYLSAIILMIGAEVCYEYRQLYFPDEQQEIA